MPRVSTKTKNRGGTKTYRCSGCKKDDNTILPGERYYQWQFRYGGPIRRHVDCGYPRRSELTNAIYGGLLDSIDNAEKAIDDATSVEDIVALVEEIASEVEDLRQQYEEAAEPFGGGGPNGEKRDEFESFGYELESFNPDESDEFDEDAVRVAATREYVFNELPPHEHEHYPNEESLPVPNEGDSDENGEWHALLERLGLDEQEMSDAIEAKMEEAREASNEKLEEAKQAAHDVLGQCPY